MAKRYNNELKVTIVELLQSGMKAKQISEDYGVAPSLISRWKKEYEAKSGDFSKKRELTVEEQERSEEHTSELQSRPHLVCRLLLEKKKTNIIRRSTPYDTALFTTPPVLSRPS